MLLPHRTAWTTQVEFQSVYSDLFESDGDVKRQQVGISRVSQLVQFFLSSPELKAEINDSSTSDSGMAIEKPVPECSRNYCQLVEIDSTRYFFLCSPSLSSRAQVELLYGDHSVSSLDPLFTALRRFSDTPLVFRFVNSLVDPLQTAYFARSISSLAAQLGLPLWFVELRHQATHEDLPGLPVLREGARQVN